MNNIEPIIFNIGSLQCKLFVHGCPQALLVQPSARHEEKNGGLAHEAELIANMCARDFALVAFDTADWARALMPWHDDAVARNEEVGLHAIDTLHFVEHTLLPWLQTRYGNIPCVIGGYSLGGLFALWAARTTHCFKAVAAASPSLWIRKWGEYANTHPINADYVYMSLGNREEHCRNQRMSRIGDCVRTEHEALLRQLGSTATTLEWNNGGHFGEEPLRTAKAFAWCLNRL